MEPTLEQLHDLVRRWARTNHPTRVPDQLVLRWTDGREESWTISSVERAEESRQSSKPREDPLAGWTDLEIALRCAIVDAGERLSTGQLIHAVESEKGGFSETSIRRTATAMHAQGKLSLAAKKDNDAHGKGYGLAEWRDYRKAEAEE